MSEDSGQERDGNRFAEIVGALGAEQRKLLDVALKARGEYVFDPAGECVGRVTAVMVDRETARPQWLAVEVTRDSAAWVVGAPVAGLTTNGAAFSTKLEAAKILGAPALDPSFVTAGAERELCRHYDLEPTRGAASSGSEHRATASRAFQDLHKPDQIGWLPGPRDEDPSVDSDDSGADPV